jgi:hypothetical protein
MPFNRNSLSELAPELIRLLASQEVLTSFDYYVDIPRGMFVVPEGNPHIFQSHFNAGYGRYRELPLNEWVVVHNRDEKRIMEENSIRYIFIRKKGLNRSED